MARRVTESGTSFIVYDDRYASQLTPAMFDAAHWPDADIVPGYSGGRGATLFVSHAGQDWVVKHYHRGGFVGRWLDDGFPWLGLDRTRSVREFDVLLQIAAAGLPAPQPVAAHCRRRGLVYTADLITRRIPGVVPFSTRLQTPAPAEVWQRVGACIGRFHAAGFYHADLSAHNLQIDADDNIFLLDWDRGEQRPPGRWRQETLDRLERSCRKISREDKACFSAADWQSLRAGYASVLQA